MVSGESAAPKFPFFIDDWRFYGPADLGEVSFTWQILRTSCVYMRRCYAYTGRWAFSFEESKMCPVLWELPTHEFRRR